MLKVGDTAPDVTLGWAVVFERLRASRALRIMRIIAIPLYILGIILSTLHQSGLGALFLLAK